MLVAEKVMDARWRWFWGGAGKPVRFVTFDDRYEEASGDEELAGWTAEDIPRFSTDIAAAWQVIEKMGGWMFSLSRDLSPWEAGTPTHRATFARIEIAPNTDPLHTFDGRADTAPLAICLAALAAVAEQPSPSSRETK